MSSQFYDQGLRETYRFPAASLTAAAVVGRFIGPAGKVGRVVNVSSVVTTTLTVDAAALTVGNNGAALPATHGIPTLTTADTGQASTYAELQGNTDLAADTVVELAADGAPGVGAADVVVTVDWY